MWLADQGFEVLGLVKCSEMLIAINLKTQTFCKSCGGIPLDWRRIA